MRPTTLRLAASLVKPQTSLRSATAAYGRLFSTRPPGPFGGGSSQQQAPAPSGGRSSLFYGALFGTPIVVTTLWFSFGAPAWSSRQDAKQMTLKANPVPALDPNEFKSFKVKDIETLNHNTKIIRVALPEGTTELGLPTASCFVIRHTNGTKEDGTPNVIIRPYTPIEDPKRGYTGHFDILVKKYPGGIVSTYLHSLAPGDSIEIKGPIKKFPYTANEFSHIGMIAGGTGITPMIQVFQRIFSDPTDKTKVSLIFANVSEDDIVLKDYLDQISRLHPDRFRVFYTIDRASEGWKHGVGFVNEEMIKKFMPAPGKGKVFFCGPPPMMNFVTGPKGPKFTQGEVGGLLKTLGYTENDVFKF